MYLEGEESKGFNFRVWLLLTVAGVVASALALPYALQFVGMPRALGLELVAANIAVTLPLLGVASFIGLKLGRRVGLRATPVLERELSIKMLATESVGFGAIIGLVVTFLLKTEAVLSIPLWMGFLASFHGAIGEEILMRLFLVSALAFVFVAVRKRFSDRKGSYVESRVIWVAILCAAFSFGLWNVQAAAAIESISFAYASKVLMQNSVGGIFFGWLYWKRGIESAMLSHFTANMILQVVSPLLAFGFI